MLSTSSVKNVSDAGHYYAATDNYYTVEQGIEQSEWFGKGAQKLHLQGAIDPVGFTQLLKGELPNGEIVGKKVDNTIIHRAGWDLTFSAPKSVSILALLAGDKRLIKAHQQAVNTALAEIERGCSETRIKSQTSVSYSYTRNMIAALFHHDLSRAEDPQLHTHSVVMNLTERPDGKWRSMASKLGRYDKETQAEVHGFIERVRNNKRYYGKLYEAELAYQVQQLGYEIVRDEKTGVFQIKGVSQEIVDYFSKRRDKIEKYLNQHGLSGSKAAEVATLHTRDNKQHSDREVLLAKWIEGSQSLGFDGTLLVKQAEERLTKPLEQPAAVKGENSLKILQNTIDGLSQFKTTFSLEDLISEASVIAASQQCDVKNLFRAVDQLIEKGDLLSLENEQGKTYLMSKKTLDDEKTIKDILSLKSTVDFNLSGVAEQHLKDIASNKAEYDALVSVFSQDKHVLIEGHHTKAVVLNAVLDVAKQEKLKLAIVGPNQATSKELALDLKPTHVSLWEKIKSLFADTTIPNDSTNSFLKQPPHKTPDILLVENAHLLSAKEQAHLLEWGKTNHTKMLFFSERDLLLSQKKGINTQYLVQHGIRTIAMNEKEASLRQAIAKADVETLFNKVSSNMVEVPEKDERLYAMASHFARLSDPKNVYLVAHNKEDVSKLNQMTHDRLKDEGKVKQFISVNVLVPQYIPEQFQNIATSYSVGNVVRLTAHHQIKGISQTEYLQIVGHDKKLNELVLKRKNDGIIKWKPDQRVEVFKKEERTWAVGERLLSHRSMMFHSVVKGEYLTIAAIRGNAVKLVRDRGRPVYIDLAKPHHSHFDYGYAATPQQLAHKKANHFIADLTANAFTTDQRRFFQLAAQPDQVTLYTDNVNQLTQALTQKSGNKLSAHEILQTSTDVKNNLAQFYQILEQAIQKPGESKTDLSRKAIKAVDYAIRHLAERNAGFTHKDLLEAAMNHAMGDVNREQLLQTVKAMEKAGILLRGMANKGVLWTTQEAIKLENEIITLVQQGKGTLEPIASDAIVQKYCGSSQLYPEQMAAIKTIVQSRDRVLAIHGRAGTGKTTMMASLSDVLAAKELWQEKGFSLLGIAPTHKAVKELKERGIPAQTIDRFLLDMRQLKDDPTQPFNKTVLIVDEASMVSNRKMRDLLVIAHQFHFRQVIPTGDSQQLAAIEAGKPHHLIQQILGKDVIRLEDIRRQNNSVLKEAVRAIYKMDVAKTFSVLGDSIIEIKDAKSSIKNEEKIKQKSHKANPEHLSYQKRVEAIASDYVNLLSLQENVQIITPSHVDRKAVNNSVRQQLEEKGHLSGANHRFSVLVSHDMTAIERSEAANFKVGHVVRFTTSSGKNIKAGDYFTIKEIDTKINALVLNNKGQASEVIWQIPSSTKRANNRIEVFKKEERDIKIGDKMVWSRTDKKENIYSTESMSVTHIDKDTIAVARPDGSTFTFNGKDEKYRHWDHAYAITAYGAQGGTYSTVLALFESYRKNLMNLKTFLVTLTRPVNHLRIYTDDKTRLQDQILSNKGDKMSSLEVISSYPSQTSKGPFKTATSPKHERTFNEPQYIYNVSKIKEGLNQNAEQLAVELLGQPKVHGGHYLKFGSKQGSLSVTIKGEKSGWWNDFSEANMKGRSMLSLIEKQYHMTKKEAIEYAARWLGIAPSIKESTFNRSTVGSETKTSPSLAETEHQKKMLQKANKIAKESVPIVGTLAEAYLNKHRGIDTSQVKVSKDVRFHPGIYSAINKQKLPALIGVVRDKNDEITAVEAVYLDSNSADKAKNVAVNKQTFGVKKGGSVTVQDVSVTDTAVIAEGTVTALSIAKALSHITVKSVLGTKLFGFIEPSSLPKNVVFCLDQDGKDLKIDKTIRDAAERLKANNKNVSFMVPSIDGSIKYDYNDVLKRKGEASIRFDFKNAIVYSHFYNDHQGNDRFLVHEGQKLSIAGIKKCINKTISHKEINHYVQKTNDDFRLNEQKLQRDPERINSSKVAEKVAEITPKTIQFEKDI